MTRSICLSQWAPLAVLVAIACVLPVSAGAHVSRAARTVDCGLLAIPAAGTSPFRGWAKGASCSSAHSLLTSPAVARALPTGSFVPPRIFRAGGFVCDYDLVSLVCWVGRVSGKRLGISAYHLLAARSARVVVATPVGSRVFAADTREAAVKALRALGAEQGRKLSASAAAWLGGCSLAGDKLLPGVRTWECTLFDSKSRSDCGGQVFVYRSGPAGTAGWRWDAIGGTTPLMCQ